MGLSFVSGGAVSCGSYGRSLFRRRGGGTTDLSFVSGNCEALSSGSVQGALLVFPLYQ